MSAGKAVFSGRNSHVVSRTAGAFKSNGKLRSAKQLRIAAERAIAHETVSCGGESVKQTGLSGRKLR
jgi:hypothetical protein